MNNQWSAGKFLNHAYAGTKIVSHNLHTNSFVALYYANNERVHEDPSLNSI